VDVGVSMKIQLREYQKECIKTIYQNFKGNRKQFIQLPTGAGKTFVFLHYLRDYSRKAVIVVPNKELEEQVMHWGKIILKDRRIVANRSKKREYGEVVVTTAQSLVYDKNIDKFKEFDFDTLIIDEAHHALSRTYKNFLHCIRDKNFNLLGCTATPERLDGQSLNDIFDRMTYSKNIVDLIRSKDLCEIEATKIKTNFKLSIIGVRNGDFLPSFLKNLDHPSRNAIIYKCFFDNCADKKTLIFCVSVEHAITTAKHFKDEGVRAECIYGDMGSSVRSAILERFKSGETQVLTNCQLLTEGFDEPSIEALIIARPTLSKSLYCQMVGRGLRNFPGKDLCHLYELADNNHNICTFRVIVGFPQSYEKDYRERERVLNLAKEYESIDIKELEFVKEKHEIFNSEDILPSDGKTLDFYKIAFFEMKVTERQKQLLKGYPYLEEMSYLEAAFTLWKQRLRKRYGYV